MGISSGQVSGSGHLACIGLAAEPLACTVTHMLSSPLQVRMVNDQLMLLERAFLNPRAFPEERYYR